MKGIVIAGAVLAMAGAAQADDWQTSLELLRTGEAIDLTSLSASGGKSTFWVMRVLNKPTPLNGKIVKYDISRFEMDCASQTMVVPVMRLYDVNDHLIAAIPADPDDKPAYIVPESQGGVLFNIACRGDRKGLGSMGQDGISAAKQIKVLLDAVDANTPKDQR